MKEPIANREYDSIAKAYADRVDTKAHNALYDRPAIQSLLSDLNGRLVLDAGCGTGVYAQWMLSQGAQVIGLDASAKMLAYARERLGSQVTLHQASFDEPLTMFDAGQFDGVLSALAISYVEDLNQPFSEFARVLKPGGWLVFSTEHPFNAYQYHDLSNYYKTQPVTTVWRGFGEPVEVPSYYHSLAAMTEPLSRNGFWIERIIEPLPDPSFANADRENYEELLNFPGFIFFRAVKKLPENEQKD